MKTGYNLWHGFFRAKTPVPRGSKIGFGRFLPLVLSLAFWWAPLWSAYSLPEEPATTGTPSESELSRLIEISTRLGKLNETLKSELEGSRKNSTELEHTLSASRIELDRLKAELESLRSTSTELEQSVARSRTESDGLKSALRKAEASWQSLELSFTAYKTEAERQLSGLEASRNRWRGAFLVAAALGLGGWVAFALTAP